MTQEAIAVSTTPPLPGLQMVQQVNAALQTIASHFAGPDDPAALAGPYMTWADTANGLIKRRNATNTAWVTVGALFAAASQHALRTIALTSAGSFTVPDNTFALDVEQWGGAGGGGGTGSTGSQAAGGGGAGGYSRKFIAVTPGQTLAYSVGAAGTAGADGGAGGSGGTSSFASAFSATGGAGGDANGTGSGGAGGTGIGGDINLTGGNGGMGGNGAEPNLGGPGGGSPFGGPGAAPSLFTGGDGVFPGGGGTGHGTGNTGPGSAGAPGLILIRY